MGVMSNKPKDLIFKVDSLHFNSLIKLHSYTMQSSYTLFTNYSHTDNFRQQKIIKKRAHQKQKDE